MPHLSYEYAKTLDVHEQRVQSWGYPYVNTIKMEPGWVLNPHAHNSSNTHFIVSGEMTVYYTKEADYAETANPMIGTFKAGDFAAIEANKCYRAVAGTKGCIFVEGHQDLSPTSAKRFEHGRTMTETLTGRMRDTGKDQILCNRGRCHMADGEMYHMCAQFRGPDWPKRYCDFQNKDDAKIQGA